LSIILENLWGNQGRKRASPSQEATGFYSFNMPLLLQHAVIQEGSMPFTQTTTVIEMWDKQGWERASPSLKGNMPLPLDMLSYKYARCLYSFKMFPYKYDTCLHSFNSPPTPSPCFHTSMQHAFTPSTCLYYFSMPS
jgi:hypothetical protein